MGRRAYKDGKGGRRSEEIFDVKQASTFFRNLMLPTVSTNNFLPTLALQE
ncbi:hypothetical protein Fmac_017375 [Flemingia macrophylla]|uniref:Uncharacterized protein n=1 Tax=Flemingia macrophylla TaxID=520843 RepID=A0ABD1M1Y3_9FABA